MLCMTTYARFFSLSRLSDLNWGPTVYFQTSEQSMSSFYSYFRASAGSTIQNFEPSLGFEPRTYGLQNPEIVSQTISAPPPSLRLLYFVLLSLSRLSDSN
jgi:hypothetical protein